MRVLKFDTDPRDPTKLSSGARRLAAGAAGVGIVALAIGAVAGSWPEFLRAYLVSFAWALSIPLGALFFVLLQHLTGASWSVVVRRIAEATAVNVALFAMLLVPIVAGINVIYEWTHGGAELHAKAGWYQPAFFVIRAAVYFGVWILLANFFLRNSHRQDESGDVALTLRMQKMAPLATILYAITLTFAAFDLLMSLDPHWYSTIFGVYYFAGAVAGFFAFLVVVVFLLKRSGKLAEEITVEHEHDIGKQLFGWIVFWAYIAFSQYMLIWYGNIPEETEWYFTRQQGGWATVSWILVFGHFLIPFLVLLPRGVKRRAGALTAMAVFVLVMHWVDCFWLVAPEKGAAGHVPFDFTMVACAIGQAALLTAGVTFALAGGSLLPRRDPRLAESLSFENV